MKDLMWALLIVFMFCAAIAFMVLAFAFWSINHIFWAGISVAGFLAVVCWIGEVYNNE